MCLSKILKISIGVLLVALLWIAFLTGPALAAAPPSISGTITNGTGSGGPVGGQTVTLTTYINASPSGTQTAVTDSQGKYQFNGLSTDTTYGYDVYVTYKGVQYSSDIIQLTAASPDQTADVKVYETTNSNATVSISTGHMILAPTSPGLVNVLEAWGFTNSGDQTYTGPDSKQETAHFTLPPGATNFSASPGTTADTATGIVTDTVPVVPGSDSVGFTYDLSYQGSSATVTLKMDYPTPSFGILIPQNGVTASSTTLTQSSPQSIQGTTYLYFTGTNLKSGQNVDITITVSAAAFSKPAPYSPGASNSTTQNSLPWLWLGAVVLVVLLVIAFVFTRLRRNRVSPAAMRTGTAGSADIEEQVLMRRIARLDDRFQDGEIDEADYKQRRAKAMVELLARRSGKKEN
jgi:hypothetical protein